MGRVISGRAMEFTPTIKFTRENTPDAPAGSYFVGVYTGRRDIDKSTTVFEFMLEDASEHTPILLRNEDKTWSEAIVGPGSKVSIIGSISAEGRMNQIMDKLDQVKEGDKVKVTYNGKKPSKKGRSFNDYTVEVL